MVNRDAGPNDAELLTRIGLVPTAEAAVGNDAVVNIAERAAHLSQVLKDFNAVVEVEEDVKRFRNLDWRREQQAKFGNQAVYQMQQREQAKHDAVLANAQREFGAAYGITQLTENNLGTPEVIQTDASSQYAKFMQEFRGTSPMRFEKRRLMRIFFGQQIAGGTAEKTIVNSAPTEGAEPVSEPVELTSAAREYPKADTRIKLEGLRDDSRAGFMPTTHREKSQAYELLSYMEPGRYEKGISTRLDEIFFRQQREMRKAGKTPFEGYQVAADSVRSVVREWGDYLTDSRSSWKKLQSLHMLIDDTPNPKISLEEMLDDEGQGETLTQLIRHDVLRKYRDGEGIVGFDPLWVREDRTKPTAEKHKTVEDMFTHKSEEFMAAYIRRRAQQMTVGEVRAMVKEAIHDQENRGKFWRTVLKSLNEDYQEYAALALQRPA
ncbi:MAG TPA: hypothetical protein VN031_02465 [Candidatus Microsaccharimonas sp.]|nr:hypothetical protein [Candidatus Microsaccharimonas sp.]